MRKTPTTIGARPPLAALLSLCALLASAQARPGPDFLRADPALAELGAAPEPLGYRDLARASLLASGVDPELVAGYESKIESLLGRMRLRVDAAAGDAALGEAVLAFLHEDRLRAYREDATALDGLLDTGRYNCVSSAALYLIATRALGLETSGVRTPDHAFCTLTAGGRVIDVETTNPYGFDPGGKKEFKDSFGRTTGYAYVAPGGYGDRRAIGAREMAGLILCNRASLLERARRFEEAAKLGVDYAALCPGPESRAFLADRINNLVADQEARGDYAGAEASAEAAAAAYPKEAGLAALAGELELVRAVNQGPFAEAVGVIDRVFAAGEVDASRYAEAISAVYGNEAGRLGSGGDWLGAAALAEAGAAKLAPGGSAASGSAGRERGRLAAVAATMRRNFVAGAHNSFARLYNAGSYADAAAAIESALASMPGDKTLERDLAAARAAARK
jgi:hypothetical protein